MIPICTIWLFLTCNRSLLSSAGFPSIFITLIITGLQIIHLMLDLEKKGYKIFPYFITIICITVLCAYNNATLATFNIIMSFILLKKTSLRLVVNTIFVSTLISFLLFFLFHGLGIMIDEVHRMPKGSAHTLGFGNTNSASMFFFVNILITAVFLIFHKKKYFVLLLFIPSLFIYRITLGRTNFYALCIFFIFIILFNIKYFQKHFRMIYILVPCLLFCVTILFNFIYLKYPILDKLFTTRFSKNSLHIQNMGLKGLILGYNLPKGEPMDSAYLAQLFAGGITSLLFFFSVYIKGMRRASESFIKNYIPFIFVILISGFAENTFSTYSGLSVLFYKLLSTQFFENFKRW